MEQHSEVFIGLDTSKLKISVAVADGERAGEVRFFGDISSDRVAEAALVAKLAKRGAKLHFCYEAGPTGYDLYRQIIELGHECVVVAPSLVPKRPGDRIKTNRRDAVSLARLHRAGELTAVWVPDEAHEGCCQSNRNPSPTGALRAGTRIFKRRATATQPVRPSGGSCKFDDRRGGVPS